MNTYFIYGLAKLLYGVLYCQLHWLSTIVALIWYSVSLQPVLLINAQVCWSDGH